MRLIALTLCAGLAACAAPPFDPDREREQLKRQADAWDAAIVRQDRAAIEANLAHDFRQIDARGQLEDRRSFVEGLMDPKLRIAPYAVEDFEIRFLGREVALLSARTEMHGHYDGKPFRTAYRYIDLYQRRDGRWRVVSIQLSPLPAPR